MQWTMWFVGMSIFCTLLLGANVWLFWEARKLRTTLDGYQYLSRSSRRTARLSGKLRSNVEASQKRTRGKALTNSGSPAISSRDPMADGPGKGLDASKPSTGSGSTSDGLAFPTPSHGIGPTSSTPSGTVSETHSGSPRLSVVRETPPGLAL